MVNRRTSSGRTVNESMIKVMAREHAYALALVALLAGTPGNRAQADGGMGRGIGAMQGAIIGDLIGGGGGAAVGAAVGAMIGAEGTVTREQEYMDQQRAAADERLAQWEAERAQREIEARERSERTAHVASLGSGIDLDLLLDIQRELMDLGYDAGAVGMQSAELTTAIVLYQQSEDLLPNGAMSAELLDNLRNHGR